MKELSHGISGVSAWADGNVTLVTVDEFTSELKDYLRSRLAEICWGPTVHGRKLRTHSYSQTMKSFWNRISTHSDNTKIGMVGELLTHLFLSDSRLGFSSVNRFFNLEERSIKKGFDLVLSREGDEELAFVEVKSSASKHINSSTQILSLLKTADTDICGKLNNPPENLWDNALNHCRSALRGDLRDRIEAILEDLRDDALESPSSDGYNVVLSGVSFSGATSFCLLNELSEKVKEFEGWGAYKSINFFATQKPTYQAIIKFIEEEAN
jgi:hypothetical protein